MTVTAPPPRPSVATRGPSRSVALPWAIAATFIVLGASVSVFTPGVAGPAIAVIGFAPLYRRLDNRFFSPIVIGPLVLVYAYHLLGFALGPWYQQQFGDSLEFQVPGMVRAQWAAVIGLAVFALIFPPVYAATFRRVGGSRVPVGSTKTDGLWPSWTLFLLVVAAVVILYGFITGAHDRLGGQDRSIGVDTASSAFQLVHEIVFFFLAWMAAKRGRRAFLFWVVVITIYSVFWFLNGGRGTVIYALVLSAAGFGWGGTSPRKIFVVGATLMLLFIPFTGLVNNYRDQYFGRTAPGLFGRVGSFVDTVQGKNGQGLSLEEATDVFVKRVSAENSDRVFLQTPSSFPYVGLEGVQYIPFAFVPQLVFPNRPTLLDGNDLAILYGGALPGQTGNYMPAVGDGYRRFGWAGIALPYAFSALIMAPALAFFWARRDRREGMATFLLAMVIFSEVWIFTVQTTGYHALWTLPKYAVLFLILRWLHDRMADVGVHRRR